MLRELVQAGYSKVADAWNKVYTSSWNVNVTIENTLGGGLTRKIRENPKKSEGAADTVSITGYWFAVGTLIETAVVHLTPEQWISSRGISILVNGLTSGLYGQYEDWVYKITNTTDKSPIARRYFASLAAFNTTQPFLYMVVLAAATFINDGKIDLNQLRAGAVSAAVISPFATFPMNWCKNRMRDYFGLPRTGKVTETASPKYQVNAT